MDYQLIRKDDQETLWIDLPDGRITTVNSSAPTFLQVKEYLEDGGSDVDTLGELLDARKYVQQGLRQLSERVTLVDDRITFDGDVVNNRLTQHLMRLLREGDQPFEPLVHFMENLAANPSRLARLHLWRWLEARDFSLTKAGHIIGYKAVQSGPENLSIVSGSNEVTVNGRIHTGAIPNPLGAEVSIGRSLVDPSRATACSVGLHVGTYDFADGFAGRTGKVLTVTVNPRDVVAVPSDAGDRKMRVCRYQVLAVTGARHTTALVAFDDEDEDEYEAVFYDEEDQVA